MNSDKWVSAQPGASVNTKQISGGLPVVQKVWLKGQVKDTLKGMRGVGPGEEAGAGRGGEGGGCDSGEGLGVSVYKFPPSKWHSTWPGAGHLTLLCKLVTHF